MSNRKNINLYYFGQAAYACINLVTLGTIFQTFMLECGISETKVSFCVSILQIVQTLSMLLLARFVENIKNIFLSIAICFFAQVLPLGVMLFISVNTGLSIGTKYALLFGSGFLLSLFIGIYSILLYKQPYHIIKMTDFGKVMAQAGVICGIFTALISGFISLALKSFEYFLTMAVVCIFGIILAIASGVSNFGFKPIEFKQNKQNSQKINIFRYKPFYELLIPNFTRGISTGIYNLTAVIGYHCGILDKTTAAIIVTLSQISIVVSSQSYVFIVAKRKSGILCLISSIVMLVSMPLMTNSESSKMFVVFYFVATFFNYYISNAVPVIVAENIDYDCIGQYTAWRMALHTGGIAVGGVLVPVLLQSIGGTLTLLVGGIFMLPCGIGYYLFDKQYRKKRALNYG